MLAAAADKVFTSPVFRCKWSLPIIVFLSTAPARFSEMVKGLGVNPKMLSAKLDSLVRHGFVVSGWDGYRLTDKGVLAAETVRPVTQHVDAEVLAEVLKCKWTREMLVCLLKGPLYSSEVVAGVPGLSWKVASDRFRKLVEGGLVFRGVESGMAPVRVRYGLTAKGRLVASWLKTVLLVGEEGAVGGSAQSYYSV